MSHKQLRILWPVLFVVATSLGTWVLMAGHTQNLADRRVTPAVRQPTGVQSLSGKTGSASLRNLSLQPEAFKMSRLLGARFRAGKREQSVLVATLTIGSDKRIVQTTRTQTDDGEQIDINVSGSAGLLTWTAALGPLSSSSRAAGSDRELIERIVFDSPDQFVLAQLRGASYYTVAYNVRPIDAGEKYAGPLWNIVRVNDPEPDEAKRPQSRWRLYFVNVATGLIDKIESEVQGQRIVAEFSGWVDLNGEQVPTQITWKRQGQILMQYVVTNFLVAEK